MLKEILQRRVEEQRQDELEAAERAKKRQDELESKLKDVEKEIIASIENAPKDVFTVPKDASPAIIIKHPADDSKESYQKEYQIYTGYCYNSDESHFHLNKNIGSFTLTLTFLFGTLDFSSLFIDEHPEVISGLQQDNCNITIFLIKD